MTTEEFLHDLDRVKCLYEWEVTPMGAIRGTDVTGVCYCPLTAVAAVTSMIGIYRAAKSLGLGYQDATDIAAASDFKYPQVLDLRRKILHILLPSYAAQ